MSSRKYHTLTEVNNLMSDERKAIKEWCRVRTQWKPDADTDITFISQHGTQLSRGQAWRVIREAGKQAGISTHTHPHMLRHACGYELTERGIVTSGIPCAIPPVMRLALLAYGNGANRNDEQKPAPLCQHDSVFIPDHPVNNAPARRCSLLSAPLDASNKSVALLIKAGIKFDFIIHAKLAHHVALMGTHGLDTAGNSYCYLGNAVAVPKVTLSMPIAGF